VYFLLFHNLADLPRRDANFLVNRRIVSTSSHGYFDVVDGAGFCLGSGDRRVFGLAGAGFVEDFAPGLVAGVEGYLFDFESKAGLFPRCFHSDIDIIDLNATV
jgi:hypothetical protein